MCLFTVAVADWQSWNHEISGLPDGRPLIIAHRGACGVYPAHSAKGYSYAIEQVSLPTV